MTEEGRKQEVCKLWRRQSPDIWQAETGVLDFYKWLEDNRPDLLPKGTGDPYQLLRGQLARCTDS